MMKMATAIVMMVVLASIALDAGASTGVKSVVVPANADVVVSIPFTRLPVGTYETNAVATSGTTVITVDGSPFTAGQLDKSGANATHYVRVIDGPGAGLWCSINSNGTNTITLDKDITATLSASGSDQDFTIRVYPHQTVERIFNLLLLNVSFADQTEVRLFPNDLTTQDLGSGGGGVSKFNTGGFFPNTWTNPGMVLPPDTGFVLRNNGSTPLVYIAFGQVPNTKVSYMLPAGVNKDTVIASGYSADSVVTFAGAGGVDQREFRLFNNALGTQDLGSGGGGSSKFNTGGFFPNTWTNPTLALPNATGYVLRQNGGVGGVITTTPVYPIVTD